MVVAPTYPGVYVEEVRSGVRTITGVATSITAFAGRALRGPVSRPVTLTSYADFERSFGGLWLDSALGYCVRDFYANGGSQAVVVRLFHPFFADDTERGEALVAAETVRDAALAAVATPQDVNAAVQAAAAAVVDPPNSPAEVAAAGQVAAAAAAAAAAPGATPESVVAAARSAADAAIASDSGVQAVVDGLVAMAEAVADSALVSAAAQAAASAITTPPHAATAAAEVAQAAVDAQAAGATMDGVAAAAAAAVGQAAPTIRASLTLGSGNPLQLEAANEGGWGNRLRARVDHDVMSDPTLFNLAVRDGVTGDVEVHRNLSVAASHPRNVIRVLERASRLVRVAGAAPAARPEGTGSHPGGIVPSGEDPFSTGNSVGVEPADEASDGSGLTKDADFTPVGARQAKTGLYALERTDLFNLLCIPPYLSDGGVDAALLADAASYCEERRALLVVDPPPAWDGVAAVTGSGSAEAELTTSSRNAAVFFPRLRQPNPLRDNALEDFAPSGAVAGVMARTDATRGVWKAPAGLDATLVGVPQLSVELTDAEIGLLNPLGVNCLRVFPSAGRLIWGARTLQGDDRLASEWKYIPVRRLALFIEETLYRGTQWAVFEPNDEPLWSQLRLNVGAFMHHLFRQGAFQGRSPKEAYLVKCDAETTTQYDIGRGVVNLVVGFAPLKPAEFVIIQIQQLAGQNGV